MHDLGRFSPYSSRRIRRHLMILVAAAGYRRWLAHSWQFTIFHFMIFAGICAIGLALSAAPAPTAAVVAALVVLILGTLGLARHGFKLADIAVVLAIILLAAGLLLPAMQQTRALTLGKRFFPNALPARFSALLHGTDY